MSSPPFPVIPDQRPPAVSWEPPVHGRCGNARLAGSCESPALTFAISRSIYFTEPTKPYSSLPNLWHASEVKIVSPSTSTASDLRQRSLAGEYLLASRAAPSARRASPLACSALRCRSLEEVSFSLRHRDHKKRRSARHHRKQQEMWAVFIDEKAPA